MPNTKPQHPRKNLQPNQHQKLKESGKLWSHKSQLSTRRWRNQVYIRKKKQLWKRLLSSNLRAPLNTRQLIRIWHQRLKRLLKVSKIWLPRLHHIKLEFQLMELKRVVSIRFLNPTYPVYLPFQHKKKNLSKKQLRNQQPKFHLLSCQTWIRKMVITKQWSIHKPSKLQWEQ